MLDLEKYRANQIKHQMRQKRPKKQVVLVNSSIIAICLQEVTNEKAVQQSLPSHAAKKKQNLIPFLPVTKNRYFLILMELTHFSLFDNGVKEPEHFLICSDRDNVHARRVHNYL